MQIRFSIALAVFLYSIFGLLDEYIIPEVKVQAWLIRYVIFCPLAIGIFLLSYLKSFQRLLEPSLIIAGFVGGAGIIAMIAMASHPGSDIYYAGLLLTSIFCFIFLRLGFIPATVLAWVIFGLYEITAVWIKGMSTPILINNSFFFVAFNITGMWACYSMERYVRLDFMQRRTIVEDVTERCKAEEALTHSEQRYKSLYSMMRLICDNVPDLIWAKDLEGKFLFVNRAICEKLLNVKDTQEPIGKTDMFFADRERNSHPENSEWHTFGEVCVDSDSVVKSTLRPSRFDEFGNVKSEFIYLDVYKAPFWNEENEMIGTVGCGRVITKEKQLEEERRRAEDQLRESEEKYRHLVENANDIIFATDAKGRFTLVNRAGLRVSGYSEEEIIGRRYLDPILPEYRDEAAQVFNLQVAKKIPYTYHEFPFMTKQGEMRWLGQNTHLLTEGETVLGFQSIARDITELKKAQMALQENEAMLRVILSTSPVGIALTSDRIVKWANGTWMTMFGFDNEQEFIGKSTRILYPSEEEYDRAGIVLFTDIEADRVNVGDVIFRRKDGSVFDGYVRTRAINPQNPSEGCISAVSDVSERKNAERARLMSENRLELALQGADLGWWDHDVETDEVVRNERWSQMLGYSQDDISPSIAFWQSLIHPEDFPKVKQAFDEHLLGLAESYESEYRLRTKEGGWKWVLDRGKVVERDKTGRPIRTSGTLLDIDKRKKSELVQRRLSIAVEQAAEGIVITDVEGNVEYMNPACQEITGYTWQDLIGRKPSLLQSGDYDRIFPEIAQAILVDGNKWAGRLSKRRKDGALYHEDVTISPVRDHTGKIVNYVGVKRDVSKEVALQQQLLQAQKMEAVGTLAGGIAHDFNNLLQVVLGFSDVMLKQKGKGDPDYSRIQKIYDAGRRGADLVKSLMTFGRQSEPILRPSDLNHEILLVHEILSRTIPKTIEIDLQLVENLESIQADPSQVGQILMNLAVNAKDAMPDGGILTFKTANTILDEEYCSNHLHVETRPICFVNRFRHRAWHGR